MKGQLPLLDGLDGDHRKHDALERVALHAADGFAHDALLAVQAVARERLEFTCDFVWTQLALADGTMTHDNRALGPVMRLAQRLKWIEPTDRFVLTDQPARHRAPIRVWRSLVFAHQVAS